MKKGNILTLDAQRARCWPARWHARTGARRRIRHCHEMDRYGAKIEVRANADTPPTTRAAINLAPKHRALPYRNMFFDEDRIRAVREMILADDEKSRRTALAKLLQCSGPILSSCSRSWAGCR